MKATVEELDKARQNYREAINAHVAQQGEVVKGINFSGPLSGQTLRRAQAQIYKEEELEQAVRNARLDFLALPSSLY